MIRNNKYLISRRIVQFFFMFLFIGGNYFGWKLLSGNYSSAMIMDKVYLSDPYALLQILSSGFWPAVDVFIGALIIISVYALIGGRMFCSWVCPLNIITDLASYLRKKFKINSLIPQERISRKTRYYILGLGLFLSFVFGIAAFELINPISMFHRALIFGVTSGLMATAFIFLFDLLIMEHAWCGHLCPVGATYSLIGKFRILKINHIRENCTMCMKCFKVCPEVQVLDIVGEKSANIRYSECTNCARCIDVCDDKALKFKISNK